MRNNEAYFSKNAAPLAARNLLEGDTERQAFPCVQCVLVILSDECREESHNEMFRRRLAGKPTLQHGKEMVHGIKDERIRGLVANAPRLLVEFSFLQMQK